jgi:HEAT repeat protein
VQRSPVALSALFAFCLLGGNGLAQEDKFLGKSATQWHKELTSPDAAARANAAFALSKISAAAEALPALVKLLQEDKNAAVREAAALAIGRLAKRGTAGPKIIDALCAALASAENPNVSRAAAIALGQCASDTPKVRAALEKALDDESKGLKQNVAWALGEICEKSAKPPVDSLRKALADSDKLVKRDAAVALGKLQAKGAVAAAVPDLLACLNHDYVELRKAVCFTLVDLVGPEDTKAAQALAKLCKNPAEDIEVRFNAGLALSNIGGSEAKAAVPILHDVLRIGDLDLKKRAALGLGNIGEAAKPAEDDLLKALKHPDAGLRHNATVALGMLKSTKAVPNLVGFIVDDNEKERVRVAACVALQSIGACDEARAAVDALIGVLANPKQVVSVRERILWSLRVHRVDLLKYDKLFTAMAKILVEPGLKSAKSDVGRFSGKMLRYDSAFLLGVLKAADAPNEVFPVLLEFLHDDKIRIYTGINVKSTGRHIEKPKPGEDEVYERGFEDGRIMAIRALERIGYERTKANPNRRCRAGIIAQLLLMRDGPTFEPAIRENAGKLLGDWGVK